MAESIPAAIYIGGTITRALAADLAAVIIDSGVLPEWDNNQAPTPTAEWLQAAADPQTLRPDNSLAPHSRGLIRQCEPHSGRVLARPRALQESPGRDDFLRDLVPRCPFRFHSEPEM